MAIDLGNAPVGTPPTVGEKAQILSAIGANLTAGPVTSLNGTSSITDGSVSVAKLSGGFGTGVLSALGKNIGTTGSVQLNGDPVNPIRINLPNVTGLIPTSGDIGLNGGKLSVGDGVTIGGVGVTQRRITGSRLMGLDSQPLSSAFVKLIGVPLTGSEIQDGKYVAITGSVSIGVRYQGTSITGITGLRFGTCWLAGASTAYNTLSSTGWYAALDNTTTTLTNTNRIKYEIASGPKQLTSAGAGLSRMLYGLDFTKYVEGSTPIHITSFYGSSPPVANSGVSNEVCFMTQIDRSGATGNYPLTGLLDVIYDLTVEVF